MTLRMSSASQADQAFSGTRDYWIPIILFGLLTMGEAYVRPEWYPAAYTGKAIIVTASLLLFRRPLADVRFDSRVIAASVAIGLAVFVVWVGTDRLVAYPRLGTRSAFDPTVLEGTSWWLIFLVVRFYGLVLMVPVMEEIFWRSFLLRYLTQPDFRQLPVGTFSAGALGIVTAASAIAHPEWLVAIMASLAYALWLRRSRSLFGAIVAHGVTNAALGAYVLVTGEWQYW